MDVHKMRADGNYQDPMDVVCAHTYIRNKQIGRLGSQWGWETVLYVLNRISAVLPPTLRPPSLTPNFLLSPRSGDTHRSDMPERIII